MGKIEDEISRLSIKDKISLTYGGSYWSTKKIEPNIEEKIITDGPCGIRLQSHDLNKMCLYDSYMSYAYPSPFLLANSFDEKLLNELGKMMALEASNLNVSMLLGPGVNIIRHPRNGRSFEYFSEDPLVTARLSSAFICGAEKNGVSTCVKHFFANLQEKNRFISNSVIDNRTIHELYLMPFEYAVKAHTSAIMASYNRVNGKIMAENKQFLNNYLRKELKFKGLILSDWGAVSDPLLSLKNGLNLEMPGVDNLRNEYIYDEYLNGNITEKQINKAVKPLIKFSHKKKPLKKFDKDKCEKLLIKAAEESIVLLKNNNDFYPLKKKDKILVVGCFFEKPVYAGSGSSKVNPIKLITYKDAFDKYNISYDYIECFDDNANITNLNEALVKANLYSKILVFVGLPKAFESEGVDRETMKLPLAYVNTINSLSKINKHIGVILECGCVTEVKEYINNIDSLIYAGYTGSMGGISLTNILRGKVSPSGKLADTYILEEDTYLNKNYPCKDLNIKYNEGLYVGYPYYYINNIKPDFCFGSGLSYGKFEYLVCDKQNEINISIENYGVTSKETLFLFVKDSRNYIRLKDFKKTLVKKDCTSNILFEIKNDYFKYYDEDEKRFVLGSGKFTILIGTSLSNIIFSKKIEIKGEKPYLHPEFDLKLSKGLFYQKGINQNSTLKDLEKYKNFEKLRDRVISASNINSLDPFLKSQIDLQYNELPIRFNTICSDKDFTIYEMKGYLSLLKGDQIKANYFFKKKNMR